MQVWPEIPDRENNATPEADEFYGDHISPDDAELCKLCSRPLESVFEHDICDSCSDHLLEGI